MPLEELCEGVLGEDAASGEGERSLEVCGGVRRLDGDWGVFASE